jgi:hypothetical protein
VIASEDSAEMQEHKNKPDKHDMCSISFLFLALISSNTKKPTTLRVKRTLVCPIKNNDSVMLLGFARLRRPAF